MNTHDFIKKHPIWIAHIGSDILFMGSPADVEAYIGSINQSTDCITISKSIEAYGEACWDEGFSSCPGEGYM